MVVEAESHRTTTTTLHGGDGVNDWPKVDEN